MPGDATLCPKCQGAMEHGAVGRRAGVGPFKGGIPAIFAADATPSDFAPGTRRLAGKTIYALSALRCTRCGYVELFAPASEGE